MREAVIVSTARTPIGKAFRGAFNNTHGATMMGHALSHAVERAGIDAGTLEDVVIGCGYPEGATGFNIGRQSALRAGFPVTVSGTVVSRYCGSGLNAVAHAAQRIMLGEGDVIAAGGVESVSLVARKSNGSNKAEPWLEDHVPHLHTPMIETAEIVSKRYGIDRYAQDAYSLESQRRTASAQEMGLFDDEIVPLETTKAVIDKESGQTRYESVLLTKDEGNRPETTYDGLANLAPVMGDGGVVTAGNASQLSDGASACILMERGHAEKLGIAPLGIFRGFASAGCEPDEMGIGPVFAVPKLLERHGLKVSDIDLWELNEAFAVQVLYCRDKLGIPGDRLNVNGGAISIGHPFGMSGSRMTGHLMLEARRRNARYAVATMCVGGGQGLAALFEAL
ncbi:acetyl-CoA C-acyltransferase [Aliihoeflea sp. PC F10.4]